MRVVVTGAAGFIGYHVIRKLAGEGSPVLALDNLDQYYSPDLKRDRLADCGISAGSTPKGALSVSSRFDNLGFVLLDLADSQQLHETLTQFGPTHVVHLAAQPGVRHSVDNPRAYADSNLVGFLNLLEFCRHGGIEHLVFASSSSVYGLNTEIPFVESHGADHPTSLYAATKKANELMAHAYSHLFRLPCTGLRLFTVYGPWGRPDMAYFTFLDRIYRGGDVELFNRGKMRRDFTYIDDVTEAIVSVLGLRPDPVATGPENLAADVSSAPYRIYNVGNQQPVEIERLVSILEDLAGRKATRTYLPMRPGDMVETYASSSNLSAAIGLTPATPLEEGLRRFVEWYQAYYRV